MVELVVHRLAADALSYVPLWLLAWILRFMRNPRVGHRLPMRRLAWCTGSGSGSSLLGAVHHLVYIRIIPVAIARHCYLLLTSTATVNRQLPSSLNVYTRISYECLLTVCMTLLTLFSANLSGIV